MFAGTEYAGVVSECASDVSGVKLGDRVFGLVFGSTSGSYSQEVVVPKAVSRLMRNISVKYFTNQITVL